jgi:hypothetical protein
VSGVLSLAKPHRIKASHRRRWKGTTGHNVYIMNNPLSGTDPTGYVSTRDPDEAEPAATEDKRSASQRKFDMACGGYCQSSAKDGGNAVGGRKGNGASNQTSKPAANSNEQTKSPKQVDTFIGGHGKGIVDNLITQATEPLLYIFGFNQVDDYGDVYFPMDPLYFGGSDSNIGQLGYDLAPITVIAASAATGKLNPSAAAPTVRYSRKLYGGSQTSSKAAKDLRKANEGVPCPTCKTPQISGTAHAPSPQHTPTLVRHYYDGPGKYMTDAQRRVYAKSSEAFDATQCLRCQKVEGAAEARYSRDKAAEFGLD